MQQLTRLLNNTNKCFFEGKIFRKIDDLDIVLLNFVIQIMGTYLPPTIREFCAECFGDDGTLLVFELLELTKRLTLVPLEVPAKF
jgi:hypothetical protein